MTVMARTSVLLLLLATIIVAHGLIDDSTIIDTSGNRIELFPADKRVRVQFNGVANFANLPVNYEYYHFVFEGTSVYTPADLDVVLKWTAAKKITMIFTARSTPDNEPFWQRFMELKQTHPEAMEKVSFYRR